MVWSNGTAQEENKLRCYPQQHAVLFLVLAPPPRRTSWNPGGTLVEPWWNPGGTVVVPWWNPRETLPHGRPGPPQSLSGLRPQSFQQLGKKTKNKMSSFLLTFNRIRQKSCLPYVPDKTNKWNGSNFNSRSPIMAA